MTQAKLIEVIERVGAGKDNAWLEKSGQSLLPSAECIASSVAAPMHDHIMAVRRNPNSAAVLRAHLQGRLFGAGDYDPAQLDRLESILNELINAVPSIIGRMLQSAHQAAMAHLIQPMLAHAIGYFLRTDDLVSDHLGALGLLDDTYLLHAFLLRINETYRQGTGADLLAEDSTAIVRVLRWVLGAEIAAHLDHAVNQEVRRAVQQPYYQELAKRPHTLSIRGMETSGAGWQVEIEKLSSQLGGAI
jgi:uncharacterized membrane protein YkvA (DUF1232 family)